jgi:hypothetical protein
MNDNRGLLETAGFTPQHMRLWEALAKDFGSQQTHENVDVPGKLRTSAGTAGNLSAIERAFAEETAPFKPMSLNPLPMITGMGSLKAGFAAFAANVGWTKLQQMAHTAKIAGIKSRNDLIRAGIIDPKVGLEMLRIGSEDHVSPTWPVRVTNALTRSSYYGMPGVTATAKEDQKSEPKKRAAGGAVGARLDHGKAAGTLCRQADQIRRKHGRDTRHLLAVPDNAVATALAIAKRGL